MTETILRKVFGLSRTFFLPLNIQQLIRRFSGNLL